MVAFEATSKDSTFSIMDNTPLLLPLYVCQVVWFDSWACCITPFPLTSPQAVDCNRALGEPPQSESQTELGACSHGWVQVQKAFCERVCQLLLILWHNKGRNQCLIGHARRCFRYVSFKIALQCSFYITCVWQCVRKECWTPLHSSVRECRKTTLKCRIAAQVSQVE